jgi:hypothetical protein
MEPVNRGVMKKERGALRIHQPTDIIQRIFSFQGREKWSRPQDVALRSALDDENFCGERLEMRAALALTLEGAGFVPSKMDAFGSERQGRNPPSGGCRSLFMP